MLDLRTLARNAGVALGMLLAVAPTTGGCIADEPILEPATGFLGPLSEAVCEDFPGEAGIAEFTTGQECQRSFSCGGSDPCQSINAACIAHEPSSITELTVLECPYDFSNGKFVPPSDTETWTDCEAALRDGQSGQTCAASFTCGRVAGPCCVELASCGVQYPDGTSESEPEPSQHLIRLRSCTQDCENVVADDRIAVDCSGAFTQDVPNTAAIGRGCRGDFVCLDGVDIREGGVAHGIDFTALPEIAFCAGDVVLGMSPVQPPALWPLL